MRCNVTLGRGTLCSDFNDETGDPITCLMSGLVNTPSKYNVASDLFWKTTEGNTLVAIKRAWNHPCIIAWDLSNEWYTYARLHRRGHEPLRQAFHGTQPCGRKSRPLAMDVLQRRLRHRRTAQCDRVALPAGSRGGDPRSGFAFSGHSSYFPDGAFLHPLDKEIHSGDALAVDISAYKPYKLGTKVLADTENQWKVAGYQPPGSCKFMDEEAVVSPAVEACAGPVIWMWKQNFDGHRDLNMGIHSNHEETLGTITRGQLLQTFIMPDTAHHGFGGRKFVRNYSILNDLFRPAAMSLQWRLVGPDGKAVLEDKSDQKMDSGTTCRSVLSLTLPDVAARTKYTLELRLYSEDRFVCGEDRDIEVWPDANPAASASRKVFLFDPKNTTAKSLDAAGVKYESAAKLAIPEGEPSNAILVIGEGALDENSAKETAALAPFVEKGGRVLVLAQSVTPQGLPVKTTLEPREWVSQPYVRMAGHPLLKGVSSWDLHFWAPDRVSARGAYSKPQSGAYVPLVDSGTETGLEWVQVMEIYRGKGLYLLCQLSLIADYGQEPMARDMLGRTLAYVAGAESFLSPTKRLRLMAVKGGAIATKMQDLGIDFELAAPDADLDANRPTLFEAGTVPAAAQQAAWKAGLAKGATLVVSGARPDDAAWLSELAGTTVRLTVPRYRMWEGRAYRTAFDSLTAGLSQPRPVLEAVHLEHQSDRGSPMRHRTVAGCLGGRRRPFGGLRAGSRTGVPRQRWSSLKVGEGRLILDQRRWMTTNEKLAKLTERNLSALALGLGVGITPPPPPREWPPDVAWRTIDITPYANRALADDVAEDGKGGWSDQGPDADLRSFPTGDRSFVGRPFKIGAGAKAIIVLKSSLRPPNSDTPAEVTIPIGYPVEGLCFLHSSAFTGRLAGGPVSDSVRRRHNRGNPAPQRREHSRLGRQVRWRVRQRARHPLLRRLDRECKMFAPISVLMMQWVNPRPDVPVKAVRFAIAGGDAVPILIGLTAGVKRDAKEAAQNLAKAQDLLKQAQAAAKPADAKDLLKKAIALAPDFTAAYQALADLCEKTGNEDEILDVYRQWTASDPRTPLPWNRLGELLEKRKDYKGVWRHTRDR